MEKNTQLPVEVVNSAKEFAKYSDADKGKIEAAWLAGYASKLQEANETIKVLTYDNNKLKGEAEVYKIAVEELKRQNDKLKEKATGWRPLLEKVLKNDAAFGKPPIKLIDKITKYLYGE